MVELSVDDLPDEDAVASALPSSVRMMADLQRGIESFTRPIAAIERMTAFVNKFDVTSRFGVVSKFDGIHSHLGTVTDLVAGHSHAADLVHQATVAAEMLAGHNHAADLVHQATVAAEMMTGHKHAADLVHQVTVAAEMMTGHKHAADLVHQVTLAAEMMTGHKYAAGLASEFGTAAELLRVHKELTAATTPWWQMLDFAKSQGIGDTVLNQFSRMAELDRGLARFLPADASQRWSAHLKLAAVPALSFLAHEWPRPVGLLAELPDAPLGASISWLLRRNDEGTSMTAALVPDDGSEKGTSVVVEGDPICAICGGPLVSLGRSTVWVGPRKWIRRHRLFPACSNCFALEHENPGTLFRALADLTRPGLRVIHGGRRGSGIPAGILHLVREETDVGDDS